MKEKDLGHILNIKYGCLVLGFWVQRLKVQRRRWQPEFTRLYRAASLIEEELHENGIEFHKVSYERGRLLEKRPILSSRNPAVLA